MFKRDQIMFNERDDSDEDMDVGEEVMAIRGRESDDQEDEHVQDDEDEMEAPRKVRKEKTREETPRGRFGKAVVDSDASESGSDSESEDEEGWGRQYYAMPSSRREKQNEDEYDERREEDRELEEREVRRLQRKARENLDADDFGLEDEVEAPVVVEEEVVVAPPTSTDPAVLLRHLEVHEPIKLALTREWPLVVEKLEKTQRGMRKLEADSDGNLHKGLGWLHYRECDARGPG
jgi:U3 small nucleolar RNA-associated protein 3